MKRLFAIAALLAAFALLCGCSVEPEATESLPPLPDLAKSHIATESGNRESDPSAKETGAETGETSAADAEPGETPRSPVRVETLDDLVGLYRAEYKALDDEQRGGIVSAWASNDFRFETPDGIIGLYTASLSREAAAVLMLCNARACVDFAAEQYAGKPEYLTRLQSGFEESAAALITLWNEPLSEEEFTNELLLGLQEAYRKTAFAGDKESREGGTTYILQAVRAYPETQGAADAEAFFAKIDGE